MWNLYVFPIAFVGIYIVELVLRWLFPSYSNFWLMIGNNATDPYAACSVTSVYAELVRTIAIAGLAGVATVVYAKRVQNLEYQATTPSVLEPLLSEHAQEANVVVAELGKMRGRIRLSTLDDQKERIPDGLTTGEAFALIGSLTGREKLRAIEILAPKLASDVDSARLVDNLDERQRRQALNFIHPN